MNGAVMSIAVMSPVPNTGINAVMHWGVT